MPVKSGLWLPELEDKFVTSLSPRYTSYLGSSKRLTPHPTPKQMTPSALKKHGAMSYTVPSHFCPVATMSHLPSRPQSPPFVSLMTSLSEGSADIPRLIQSSHSSQRHLCLLFPIISDPKRHVALSEGPHRVLLGLLACLHLPFLVLVWMVLKVYSGCICVGTGHWRWLCGEMVFRLSSSSFPLFEKKIHTQM